MTVNLYKLYGHDDSHIGYSVILSIRIFKHIMWYKEFQSNKSNLTVYKLEPVFDMKEVK